MLSNKITLMGINETKVRQAKSTKVSKVILSNWKFIFNNAHHPNGRVWVAKDPLVLKVDLEFASSQLMHVSATIIDNHTRFFATFVYGFNTAVERVPLWRDICRLSGTMGHQPWILLGDFNVARYASERIGGDPTWHPYMEDHNCCCYDAQLDDLRFTGHLHTWSNTSPEENLISRKLDRVLINSEWESSFTGASSSFLPLGFSDHSPILVSTGILLRPRKSPFKFFNFWADHPEFESVIASAWSTPIYGSPLYQVCQKLKLVKASLKDLNRRHYKEIHSKANLAKKQLFEIQNQLSIQPDSGVLRRQEKKALEEFITLSKVKEFLHRKKSRVH